MAVGIVAVGVRAVIDRTELPGNIVVTDDVIRSQPLLLAEPCCKLDQRPIRRFGEFPGLVRMAAFNTDRVVVFGVIGLCHFPERHTLDDLAVKTDDKMRTRAPLIVVVLLFADIGVQVLRGNRLAETIAEVDRGVVAGV